MIGFLGGLSFLDVFTFVFSLCFMVYAMVRVEKFVSILQILGSLIGMFLLILFFDVIIFNLSLGQVLRGANWKILIVYGCASGLIIGLMLKILVLIAGKRDGQR